MLEERCRGHRFFRVLNCGGRGWNWEGRRAATCLAAAPPSHTDARSAVSLECARLLQPSPDHPVELFQIIGQDSYEGAVRKSNGMVLNKLLHPPRPGKKLLVLDIDYTLMDHRSTVVVDGQSFRDWFINDVSLF
jgi:hypothetical protein